MAKGRNRKAGKRTKSGQLSRAGLPAVRVDKGNPVTELKTMLYGPNGSDAIGRAFERGLLGTGSEAKTMLDTGRAIHRAYWASYLDKPVRCALADHSGGSARVEDEARDKRQEAWLNAMLKSAERGGRPVRVLFDQLVVDIHPDYGPPWLDRIIERKASEGDWGRLATALDALAECAGVQRLTARCA